MDDVEVWESWFVTVAFERDLDLEELKAASPEVAAARLGEALHPRLVHPSPTHLVTSDSRWSRAASTPVNIMVRDLSVERTADVERVLAFAKQYIRDRMALALFSKDIVNSSFVDPRDPWVVTKRHRWIVATRPSEPNLGAYLGLDEGLEGQFKRYPCPCCGYIEFEDPPGSYSICEICFWEDAWHQLVWPDASGGPNHVSLVEAQRNYQRFGAAKERMIDAVRRPAADDRRDPMWRPFDSAGESVPAREDGPPLQAKPTELYYWHPDYWRREQQGN